MKDGNWDLTSEFGILGGKFSTSKVLFSRPRTRRFSMVASVFPHRPHSPGHRPPLAAFSTIQGSMPCSRKEITSGLEMARPGHKKKTHHPVMVWGPRIQIQDLVSEQERPEEDVTVN